MECVILLLHIDMRVAGICSDVHSHADLNASNVVISIFFSLLHIVPSKAL